MELPFVPALVWVFPFVAMLLAIAVVPLAAPHFWESNRRKLIVSVVLGAPVLALYMIHQPQALLKTAEDYLSFMVLLGSLYAISAGVLMDGDIQATPFVNSVFLFSGALLASVIGTTGASMLLIRPLLRTNSERRRVAHTVVFFIFLVSNIGGCLTPLGDPPLFLGYLQGVPFTWTFRLILPWLFTTLTVLAIYYVWDRWEVARETPASLRADREVFERLEIRGLENILWISGVLAAAAFLESPWREVAMLASAGLSLYRTPKAIHDANHFAADPIVEVAVVFGGIFATMMPALDLLRARGAELGVTKAWHYFWAAGALSSFLDNAPTYLTFLALGQGQNLERQVVGVPHEILAAISLGAVFMGANSYIGNAPNFMVRSIAESRGVKMPSFGGYMLYSCGILIPVFVAVTVIFF